MNSVQGLVQKLGGAASEVILDSPCLFFRIPTIEGVIGYRIESGCAVVFGDPICEFQDMPELAKSFKIFCDQKGLKIIYIIASEQFKNWAIQNHCKVSVEVGEEVILDPYADPRLGPKGRRLRNRLTYAQKNGLEVHEYISSDSELEKALQEIATTWVKARKGPQLYLSHLNFFNNKAGKRWFYIEDQKRILGMALLCKLESKNGWLLKYVIILPNSPRGTSELLVMKILEKLQIEGCHFLTYGMVPSDSLGEVLGLNKLSTWLARKAFLFVKWYFHLDQRKEYWEKFRPNTEPVYVLFQDKSIGLNEVRALSKSFKYE